MDPQTEALLQLMDQPVFLVQEGLVSWCNRAAEKLVSPGEQAATLLGQGMELYDLWDRQTLLETELTIFDQPYGVRVREYQGGELFVLKALSEEPIYNGGYVCQASGRLRVILQELFPSCQRLQDYLDPEEDLTEEASLVNRALYRLLGLSNELYYEERIFHDPMEVYLRPTNMKKFLTAFVREAGPVVEDGGWRLSLSQDTAAFHSNVDRELLQHGLYYMLTYGLRSAPKGSELVLKAKEEEKRVQITLLHPAPAGGYETEERNPLVALPRAIASLHGGALFHFPGEGAMLRQVLTIRKQPPTLPLGAGRLEVGLYGDRHPALVELSRALDKRMYHPDRV